MLRCAHLYRHCEQSHARQFALEDISLELADCEQLAVIGNNGSGVSSLLNVFALLDSNYQGELWLDHLLLEPQQRNLRSQLRITNIGIVLSQPTLLGKYNALENIALPLELLGWSHALIEQTCFDWLTRYNLDEKAFLPCEQLSLFEQQQLAVIRALIKNPRWLVADDPGLHLRRDEEQQLLDMLSYHCQQQHCALLLGCHHDQLPATINRRCYMQRGKLFHQRGELLWAV